MERITKLHMRINKYTIESLLNVIDDNIAGNLQSKKISSPETKTDFK